MLKTHPVSTHPVSALLSPEAYEYNSPSINSAFMPMSKHFFNRQDGQKRRVFLSTVQLFWNMHRWRFCSNKQQNQNHTQWTYCITVRWILPLDIHCLGVAALAASVDLPGYDKPNFLQVINTRRWKPRQGYLSFTWLPMKIGVASGNEDIDC